MVIKLSLVVLTVIGAILFALNKWASISHWIASGWNMSSYNPLLLPISWGSWLVYMYMTVTRGPGLYFWFIGILWLVGNVYFSYGMMHYWVGV